MCGIAGFIRPGSFRTDWAHGVAEAMADRIAHRGPDDAGVWLDQETGVALAHRRLSIIDLSASGHQPMVSGSGRFVITYNGEIYNHLELRREIERRHGHMNWHGHSDTETLLACIDLWGIEETLDRIVGMFAIAVWDAPERQLILARDRLGEKPLYYGWQNGSFLFGSELKALRAHPDFANNISRDALAEYCVLGYVPGSSSIYEGISKLAPGTYLRVPVQRTEGERLSASMKANPYWSLRQKAETGDRRPFHGTESEAVSELERLLITSVTGQSLSDVPLGAFLSGGIDSSTIVSVLQAYSETPVRTFTIGFHEKKYNEAEYAKAVAEHLGTAHTELYVTGQDALDVIPQLPNLYDEPFADSSQIPTFLVSHLAQQHVKVALSGDGGDELFCGYDRYQFADRMWGSCRRLPGALRHLSARVIDSIPNTSWDRLARFCGPALPRRFHNMEIGERLHKFSSVIASADSKSLYGNLMSQWRASDRVVIGGKPDPDKNIPWLDTSDLVTSMMATDLQMYLPDDLLVKVDRAAMGLSLETRVPLLDHRVVEFALRLPRSMKLRNGESKWPLRQVLRRYLPDHLIDRPKMGFRIPVDSWLRGPLKAWAEGLLDENRLRQEGFFDPKAIHRKWREHQSGKRNWQSQLWIVLMFQQWQEQTGR